jgi:hypothetical protein
MLQFLSTLCGLGVPTWSYLRRLRLQELCHARPLRFGRVVLLALCCHSLCHCVAGFGARVPPSLLHVVHVYHLLSPCLSLRATFFWHIFCLSCASCSYALYYFNWCWCRFGSLAPLSVVHCSIAFVLMCPGMCLDVMYCIVLCCWHCSVACSAMLCCRVLHVVL